MSKVAIIGAGNVGATTAYCLAEEDICDVVMVDVVEGLPQSKAMDFLHARPSRGYHINVLGTNDFSAIAGADIVVHTAGLPRKPGMDRMDLMKVNVEIAVKSAQAIARYAPDAVIIAVANPLDIIAQVCLKESGFAKEKVIGMAGVLDSTRFRYFIAEKLNINPLEVQAMVMGGHGDDMVPLPSFSTVGGQPITELLTPEEIKALADRTRVGGGEIVNYLKTGSAFYGPGASTAKMAQTMLKGERCILPVSAYLQGEYGYQDLYLGVPVYLGRRGIEKVVELPLSNAEKAALDKSAASVREGLAMLQQFYTAP